MHKLWYLSLGLSLAIHFFVFVGLPRFYATKINKQHNPPKSLKMLPNIFEKIEQIRQNDFSLEDAPPYINEMLEREIFDTKRSAALDKADVHFSNKEIIFSEMSNQREIKKTPAYMNYYNTVREKIRKNAYHYYNSRQKGIIYISFVVLQSGDLFDQTLLEESTVNKELIDIAFRSIRTASPFPPFPKELDYPKLQFNVSIHFKNN
jgi:hypothetical protein